MEKQENAFSVWANWVLQIDDPDVTGGDLTAARLSVHVRALLWKLYSEDMGVINVMLRLEERIDAGLLQIKNEVCIVLKINL